MIFEVFVRNDLFSRVPEVFITNTVLSESINQKVYSSAKYVVVRKFKTAVNITFTALYFTEGPS